MSLQNAREYINELAGNDSIWDRHKRLRSIKDAVRAGEKEGYEFTREELDKAIEETLRRLIRNYTIG